MDILANYLQQEGIRSGRTYLSGFEGLLSLYQEKTQVAACHLYDGQSYNDTFVRTLMPGVPAVLINVSYRMQGFYVKKGNPKNITDWEDLRREDISILNRRPGSSARILMDMQLKKLGILASSVKGYQKIMKSHLTMAAAIAEGEADLAIGTERVSRQIDGIDFIPLMEERFDLIIRKDALSQPAVQKMLAIIRSSAFQKEISAFSGNDYRDIGKVMMEV